MEKQRSEFRMNNVKNYPPFSGLNIKKIKARQHVLIVALLLVLGFGLIMALRSFSPPEGDGQPELIHLQGNATQVETPEVENLNTFENLNAFEGVLPSDDALGTLKDPYVFESVIARGDTMGTILQEWLPMSEVHSIINDSEDIYPFTKIKAGNPYIVFSNAGKLCRFEYVIDDTSKLVINREAENCYQAIIIEIPYEKHLAVVDGIIDSNLFMAVADAGEAPGLAIALGDMFGYEINFIRDLRAGDTFTALIEKRYQYGVFKSYGPLLAAYFVNQENQYEGFYFSDDAGSAYFTREGESLRRAFLKTPLSFTRISSGYNLRRVHPIFKEVRPHPAIDYAAPTGTPIKAIGRGTITFAGWGKGAGKYITISHPNNYGSTYMHMSAFASGIKKGTSVRRGQVIGYVGSTGYSTGPHLDFRMKHNGKYINPASVTSPREEPVKPNKKEEFLKRVQLYHSWMNGEESLNKYPEAGF